jgi:hypothetical protein
VGSTQEIHDRERKLILRLAKAYLEHLRNAEGATQVDPPAELEWGHVVFRAQLARANVRVSFSIDP